MALPITGQAQGLILGASQKAGTPPAFQSGWNNELLNSELLPRYANLVQSGEVYCGALTSGAALVAAGTAAGPFTLYNPTSGAGAVNLVLLNMNIGITAVPTAGANEATIQLATTVGGTLSTVTAGGNIVNSLIGSSRAPSGIVYTVATISAACKAFRNLAYVGDVATTSVMVNGQIEVDLAGSVIIGPGGFVTLIGVGTTPANFSVTASATWAELPV